MGRLNDLEKTFLKNLPALAFYDCEFILVNYNSPDIMHEWVMDNLSKYIKAGSVVYRWTKKPYFFNFSHSKNVSHKLASGDILVNLDADNYLSMQYIDRILEIFEHNSQCHGMPTVIYPKPNKDNMSGLGRIAISRELFYEINGYNERFEGYGYEDIDLINRCRQTDSFVVGLPMVGEMFREEITLYEDKIRYLDNKSMAISHWGNKILSEDLIRRGKPANEGKEWGEAPFVSD
jgi:predicted glycosyltransferase involved in capsule biosynthesis